MGLCKFVFLVPFCFVFCQGISAQTKLTAERLGYSGDTKLLIIHADDLAVAHSEDSASFEALDRGAVTSASIIVPALGLRK